ncbi:carbamoyl-phosphate synthase (glutamine-hydrolyzing) large subunit, partial [Candidatus Woesearchaeota archaeon]|nr:carbamoyl-phosphate synthase (glutamine-hydrolyzing) large subunit [Candidatus Woesearchaeota archaeon]
CITVCNMENMDPLGIHTGESIVVAPSQTLTNEEYHTLREVSIQAIRHLGIVGECNIQFALHPKTFEFRIIEVNARLSRSSALASKATGYPLAFIAAKLALGYTLIELQNSITKQTSAFFEPALDYIVVKIPRWDLQKFREVSRVIGSGMKSVGEVMAIGRKFEEAMQKAIRMLGIGMHGLVGNKIEFADVEKELKEPTDLRIFAIVQALKEGYTVEEISKLTHINKWFLYKIEQVIETERQLKKYALKNVPKDFFLLAKQQGFSDFQLARTLSKSKEMNRNVVLVRKWRKRKGITPFVKQIDTLAGEFPAKTNYLYLTYNASEHDIQRSRNSIIVLGSGPYRIGSSVEFDWCCVNAVMTTRTLNHESIMINCNPETVSTDYDICDRLYFEELTFERVMDIYERENPKGIIISMGGQIPNNLAMRLHREKVRMLGTSPIMIDSAENRHKFSKLLDTLHIDQPEWKELTNLQDAKKFANKVGYPVLVRPSYVLSGAAMAVAFNDENLATYLQKAAAVSKEHPVVLSKFILGAKEIEIDGVAKNGEILCHAISEHVENAGVHSGDATMVLPPQKIYLETMRKIKQTSRGIVRALKITGPFNIQYIAKENQIRVIECNLRASRSFPFVSKVMKTNFIDIATKAMLNAPYTVSMKSALDLDYVGVKSPQFSFSRLTGADPMLGVEMASTGEVACFGDDLYEAFLKSIISSGYKLPNTNVLVSISGDKQRYNFLRETKLMQKMGYHLYATEHTSAFLNQHNIPNRMIYKAHNMHKENNVATYMEQGKLDFVIAAPNPEEGKFSKDHYVLRRKAVDHGIPLVVNLQVAKLFVRALANKKLEDLKIKEWGEY